MRRRQKSEPEPLALDAGRVRELLEEAAAARNTGKSTYRHPALAELGKLCGVMAEYAFAFLPQDVAISPTDLDELEERILRLAPQWLGGERAKVRRRAAGDVARYK